MFCKVGVLKIFAKFTGKHLCWGHFLTKLHTCFPMIFVEFSRTLISKIKSILIHEYQHKSIRVNTNEHESTRINTSLTRVNTSPTRVNTSQHESTRVRHESTRINTSLTRVNTSPKQVLDKILLKIKVFIRYL